MVRDCDVRIRQAVSLEEEIIKYEQEHSPD